MRSVVPHMSLSEGDNIQREGQEVKTSSAQYVSYIDEKVTGRHWEINANHNNPLYPLWSDSVFKTLNYLIIQKYSFVIAGGADM